MATDEIIYTFGWPRKGAPPTRVMGALAWANSDQPAIQVALLVVQLRSPASSTRPASQIFISGSPRVDPEMLCRSAKMIILISLGGGDKNGVVTTNATTTATDNAIPATPLERRNRDMNSITNLIVVMIILYSTGNVCSSPSPSYCILAELRPDGPTLRCLAA